MCIMKAGILKKIIYTTYDFLHVECSTITEMVPRKHVNIKKTTIHDAESNKTKYYFFYYSVT